jgi:hypothetical protein
LLDIKSARFLVSGLTGLGFEENLAHPCLVDSRRMRAGRTPGPPRHPSTCILLCREFRAKGPAETTAGSKRIPTEIKTRGAGPPHCRCQANSALKRQPRPDSGLGLSHFSRTQLHVVSTCCHLARQLYVLERQASHGGHTATR